MAIEEEIIQTSNHEFTSKTVPTEIILEILLRLPVESLLRCKSVCKLWFSLISDPHFVKSHLKLSAANNQLFWIRISSLKSCPVNDLLLDKSVINVVDHDYPWSYDSNPLPLHVRIADSCNGLICIVVDRITPYICNPSTRMWKRLPSPGFQKQIVVYGFGYDVLTDDYKVVGINLFLETEAKIFSLKSEKWKNIDVPDGIELYCGHGVFLNGSIHWAAQDSNSSSVFTILSFDLVKETYGQVVPPVYDDVDNYVTFGVLGDSLCVACDYCGDRTDVWVMKVYGVKDSWTKLVSIPYRAPVPNYLRGHISVPVFFSDDGKVLFQSYGAELVVYDSKNKSFFEIQNVVACDDVCTFVESLVSPGTGAGLAINNVDDE